MTTVAVAFFIFSCLVLVIVAVLYHYAVEARDANFEYRTDALEYLEAAKKYHEAAKALDRLNKETEKGK